jgi:hypothetical protein
LSDNPTHVIDEVATAEARNRARRPWTRRPGNVVYKANMRIVPRGEITQDDWMLLKAEN